MGRFPNHLKRFATGAAGVAAIAAVLAGSMAQADFASLRERVITFVDDLDVKVFQTLGYGRAAEISTLGDVEAMRFENLPYSLTEATGRYDLVSGAALTFGADYQLTGHPQTSTRTEHRIGLDIDYALSFGEANAWRMRIFAEADFAQNSRRWIFHRERIGAKLQYRDSGGITIGTLRFGMRQQNENTFEGFDQAEYLADVTRIIRPFGGDTTVVGSAYAEFRRADADQYSYDEWGLRGSIRVPMMTETDVIARVLAYERSFDGVFSATLPVTRTDSRLKATFEIEHQFSDQLEGQVYVGYDQNRSNVGVRAYDGAIVGVNFTYNWD